MTLVTQGLDDAHCEAVDLGEALRLPTHPSQTNMSTLVLVRHGQSVYNLENRFTGSLDIGLTPLGEEQARQAGIRLKGCRFDVAFTSLLARAQESLRIILEVLEETGIPVVKNGALDERSYGSLQGLNKEETASVYGAAQVEIWRRSYEGCPPDGESLAATYGRAVSFFKAEIEPQLRIGKKVLVVAHGNSLRALMMYLEDISRQDISKVDIPTGQPRAYEMDADLKIWQAAYL